MIDAPTHLRRYGRWYRVLLVWAIAMLVVAPTQRDQVVAEGPSTTTTSTPGTVPPPTSVLSPGPDPTFAAPPVASPVTTATSAPPTTSTTAAGGVDLLPLDPLEELLGQILSLVPPPQLPLLPPELDPLLQAIRPLASTGCSVLGLVNTLMAVVPSLVDDVPLELLRPYLAIVATLCANVPVAEQRTVCAADLQLALPSPLPAIVGTAVDQVEAIELLISSFGGPPPILAHQLRAQLDCELIR